LRAQFQFCPINVHNGASHYSLDSRGPEAQPHNGGSPCFLWRKASDIRGSRTRLRRKLGREASLLPLSLRHNRDKESAPLFLFVLSSFLPSLRVLFAQVILNSFAQGLGTQIGAVKLIFG